jgi:hypothetical protein
MPCGILAHLHCGRTSSTHVREEERTVKMEAAGFSETLVMSYQAVLFKVLSGTSYLVNISL